MLHLCCLLDLPQIVRFLLETYAKEEITETSHKKTHSGNIVEVNKVKFVDAMYTGRLYCGEVALHLACANSNLEIAKMLLEHEADCISPFAHGEFFRGFLYYGSSVLAFAAKNDMDIFRLLVQHGTKD